MYMINYILCYLLCACLFTRIGLALDSCGIYKNTKFNWWGTDCGNFCHQANSKVTCSWFNYHQGCFCKDGFYRDRNWDCIPLKGCDASQIQMIQEMEKHSGVKLSAAFKFSANFKVSKPVITVSKSCPPNEIWKKCDNMCSNHCESRNNPKNCKDVKCTQGCFCKSGMLRNYNGACIKSKECDAKMMSGTYKYKHSFTMSISLSIYTKKTVLVTKGCTKLSCQFDKKEGSNCGANEEYTTCGDKCSEQCKNLYLPENCPVSCDLGCFCLQDHYRNEKGECVVANSCDKYEERKQLTTTTKRPKVVTEIPIIPPFHSTPKYKVTTTTQKVIETVIDSKECPENERFSQCDSHCKEMCENSHPGMRSKTKFEKCPPNLVCMEGCFCEEGHYRDLTDKCVPRDKCPPPMTTPKPKIKCKPNANEEFTTCGSKCSESCDSFNTTTNQNCPPTCDEGCFCVQGFYRDKYGQCVPQDQCQCELEPLKCKDSKEEYLVCGKNCMQTCDIKSPECEEDCARGCFCKSGFIYNENGVCVQPNQCGKDIRNGTKAGNIKIVKPGNKCSKKNEKWSNCGNLCIDFCDGVTKIDVEKCSLTCVPTCVCRKGFKRNAADQCVEIAKCNDKPVCGENEFYSESDTHCFSRCKDIGHNIKCPLDGMVSGCFCKKGYMRDDSGKCIAKSKCPRDLTPDCPTNEVYKNCSTRCGETCEDLKSPVECPDECEKGCFCADGYYRDADGICGTRLDCNLPEDEHKEKSCSENEVYKECGNRCEDACEISPRCMKTCESGCFCIQDYLRNAKGQCINSDLCMGPPQCAICKDNEYYTSCGTDCGRMCSDIGKKVKCGKSTPCHMGCLCKWGFFRTLDGECVTKNECKVLNEEDDRQIEYVTTEDPDDEVKVRMPYVHEGRVNRKRGHRHTGRSLNTGESSAQNSTIMGPAVKGQNRRIKRQAFDSRNSRNHGHRRRRRRRLYGTSSLRPRNQYIDQDYYEQLLESELRAQKRPFGRRQRRPSDYYYWN